jgi:hypothetical protein
MFNELNFFRCKILYSLISYIFISTRKSLYDSRENQGQLCRSQKIKMKIKTKLRNRI